MAKGKGKDMLYRAAKFEIRPNEDQIAVLRRISDNLWLVWNNALEKRQALFDRFMAPLYERLKTEKDAVAIALIRQKLKAAYKEHKITLFDQINALTPWRQSDAGAAAVPRNWQEETLDTLYGAFKSFVVLRKNGDSHARPPRLRDTWNFCEIPGRYGFKIRDGEKVKEFVLSCDNMSEDVHFVFPVPAYQQKLLKQAAAVKKFTLFRDEPDMRKPGRFWVTIVYEINRPEKVPFAPEEAVYVALGASFIGVVSQKGEEVIPLWRPDRNWKPRVDAIGQSLKKEPVGTNIRALSPGSRKGRKLQSKRRGMFAIMSRQQRQDRREVVASSLLRHGIHFVVSDLVVRGKKDKLADSSRTERRGPLCLNWSAQNTGSIGYLVLWLAEKAEEHGGTVRKHKISGELPRGKGAENKIAMARRLRESFLSSLP